MDADTLLTDAVRAHTHTHSHTHTHTHTHTHVPHIIKQCRSIWTMDVLWRGNGDQRGQRRCGGQGGHFCVFSPAGKGGGVSPAPPAPSPLAKRAAICNARKQLTRQLIGGGAGYATHTLPRWRAAATHGALVHVRNPHTPSVTATPQRPRRPHCAIHSAHGSQYPAPQMATRPIL